MQFIKIFAVRRKFISLRVIWSTSGYNSKQCLVNFKTDKFLKITFFTDRNLQPTKKYNKQTFYVCWSRLFWSDQKIVHHGTLSTCIMTHHNGFVTRQKHFARLKHVFIGQKMFSGCISFIIIGLVFVMVDSISLLTSVQRIWSS